MATWSQNGALTILQCIQYNVYSLSGQIIWNVTLLRSCSVHAGMADDAMEVCNCLHVKEKKNAAY